MKPYILKRHLNRVPTFYEVSSPEIPKALFEAECVKPDLTDFPLPLPSKKKDYTCFVKTDDGCEWYGGISGLTRYDADAERIEDKVMYFAADRHLYDNKVEKLLADGNSVWVKTEKGVVHIDFVEYSTDEKANVLLQESLDIVDRRGMISHRILERPRDLSSKYPDNECDNDGGFTAAYAVGEIFHYATLAREKGADHPETLRIKAVATRACEACLLLFYLPGRGDGFFARTYMCPDERLPEDGLFFRREGDYAYLNNSGDARGGKYVGAKSYCGTPIPERLSHLYTDLGYTADGLLYKADTSSDEVTLHYLMMRYAHEILGPVDPELDEIIKETIKKTTYHFIDNGYQMVDFHGGPTAWAKWNMDYFNSEMGWSDGALNAAELMFYFKAADLVLGGDDKIKAALEDVYSLGYPELATKHHERFYKASMANEYDLREDMMYGDHMLAVVSYWQLCDLEKDEKLLEMWKKGFRSWRTTLAKEHTPCYDFPYTVATGDEIDMERAVNYFYRCSPTRLASGVTIDRKDYPMQTRFSGTTKELSSLLPADERHIAKYDRNPMAYRSEDSHGMYGVESCFVYTFAYWTGRYYGLIGSEE
ncbi:MAG: hypothetical protein IJF20_05675 [Clostridia bacterium]|nr:hypothetical protein [Clostridia bacterium]